MAAFLAAGGFGFLLLVLVTVCQLPALLGLGPVGAVALTLALLLALAVGLLAGVTHVASGLDRIV
jgi:hypothetical protein